MVQKNAKYASAYSTAHMAIDNNLGLQNHQYISIWSSNTRLK